MKTTLAVLACLAAASYGACPRTYGFVAAASSILQGDPNKPVYEFGSKVVKGQEAFSDYRYCLPNRRYVGCDIAGGAGVDRICDVQVLDLPASCAGSVICTNTLEHLLDPPAAVREMCRVLDPNGSLLIVVPAVWPAHEYPYDFWRVSPPTLRALVAKCGPWKFLDVRIVDSPDAQHRIVCLLASRHAVNLDHWKYCLPPVYAPAATEARAGSY
jgi:SAM-dependent methyltransferase